MNTSASTGLETVAYNGSIFYHAWNDGSISNQTWLNKSSGNAQLATTEGQGIEEAIARMDYYTFRYGVFWMQGNRPRNYTLDDLSAFTAYGFSNNASYWRTESNRSFFLGSRQLTLRFKHEQQATDDLISVIVEANASGNINLPNNAWLGIGLTDITGFDTVNYANESGTIYYEPVGGNATFSNWTLVKVSRFEDGWGWRFENATSDDRLLAVDGDDVWLLFRLGTRISGNKRFEVKAIDDITCVTYCQSGDATSIVFSVDGDDNQQVPDSMSMTCNWTDVYGTCGINLGCALITTARNPYASLYARTTVATAGNAPYWMYCNLANSSHGCESNAYARKTNPVKNTEYTWQLQEGGKYALTMVHDLRCEFNGLPTSARPTSITGSDTTAPNVSSCTIGGQDLLALNNTVIAIPPSNGSTAWANATFSCAFDNTTTCGSVGCFYYNATGLVNTSGLWLNRTGFTWNTSDLVDRPYGTQTITYRDLQDGQHYRVCAGVNGTSTATSDRNWSVTSPWCYIFGIDIVPPQPGAPDSHATRWFALQDAVEDEEPRRPAIVRLQIPLLFGLALAVVGAVWHYFEQRSTPSGRRPAS